MSILSFNYAVIKNPEAFQEYVQKAAALMEVANVEVVARAKFAETILGAAKEDHISAIFRYPSLNAAKALYASDQYKEIIPLRDKACEMNIHFYTEL